MKARSFLVRAAGATLLALSACSNSTAGTDNVSGVGVDAVESDAVYEINRAREEAGIAATLVGCASLNASASAHSDDMRNKGYLKEEAPDGSTVRTRSCAAGYQPGCVESTSMGELVASGIDEGKDVVARWLTSIDAKAVLVSPGLLAVGVGRSLSDDGTMFWTVDLGGSDDPSCQ